MTQKEIIEYVESLTPEQKDIQLKYLVADLLVNADIGNKDSLQGYIDLEAKDNFENGVDKE